MLTFDNIFGQAAAVAALEGAYLADRLPHGLIFAGPVGVGKATTARALAGLFLCESPAGARPCGRCPSCRSFEAGTHPDFHVVYRQLIRLSKKDAKARDLSVDVIRERLVAPAALKPALGRGKAFVVKEAELMNPAAQNSMLKTLEEPGGRTLIVLLTDQPGALLPTIRSRCQTVGFLALSRERVEAELIQRGNPPAMAKSSADLAEGSLGLALRWIEDGVVAPAAQVAAQIDSAMAGLGAGDLPGLLKQSAEAYAERQLERDALGSKDQATREGLTLYLRLAAEQSRRRLHAGADPARACAAIDALARAERYLDENVNVSVALQQLTAALERA